MKREKYLKRITAVFLCILLVLSLAACGSEGGSGGSDTSTDAISEGNNTADESSKNGKTSDEIAELEQRYANLTEDELTWEYNTATKTVVISGKGPMKDYAENAPEWDKYADEAEKVVIGDEVTSVGMGAFLWFSAITEVQLGESVEFIGDAAFSNCECLWTVNFPANLKYVGDSAFNNAVLHSENGFKFPEGMLYIGDSAFRSAFKEGTVSIPASLLVIEDGTFANMFVSAFVVDENNPNYASVDGVLYDKGITSLINYPADKQDVLFEIPDTVTDIREEAIEVTNTLEKIVIPASVSSIEEGTERVCNYSMSQAKNLTEIHTNEGLLEIGDTGLYLCENLKTLGLPKSLTNIEAKALTFCDSLTEIRYAGTGSDWKTIRIGEDNELLTNGSVQIYCAE